MQGIVISLVAAVACRFMQDRHADLYLGSKRDDFGWCETTPQYLRCNFIYKALGMKAHSGEVLWCATSSLVIISMPSVIVSGMKIMNKIFEQRSRPCILVTAGPETRNMPTTLRTMANRKIYTRVYSKGSAGQLASAKAPKGDPLSRTDLRDEFRKHANKYNREPTALVSVSDRIVDTVKRAFKKEYEDGELPADISVAFIEIPAATHEEAAQVHAARLLAEECRLPEPGLFSHEIIFEWAIPEKYVLHTVSLQTLMDRGLRWEQFCPSGPELQPLSTAELRCCIAMDLQHASRGYGPWEVGVYLACFAQNFGARAPLDWISHQLFYDCVWTKIVDDDVVRLKYADKYSETVDFDFFCELDHGIETVLYDWWLADIEFL